MRTVGIKTAASGRAKGLSLAVALVLLFLLTSITACAVTAGHLARIKDVATIEGIRDNQLVG